MWKIKDSWKPIIEEEYKYSYFQELTEKIKQEYAQKECYPKYEDIMNAFNYFELQELKVIILGQDPYHTPDKAHGLAFSIKNNSYTPSIKNLIKKIEIDTNQKVTKTNLENWAKQGVLLLNTILSVEKGKPLSHKNLGWEIFTKKILEKINTNLNTEYVVVLLGKNSEKYESIFENNKKVKIIKANHPSPLSSYKNFFNVPIFNVINDYLIKNNKKDIIWNI